VRAGARFERGQVVERSVAPSIGVPEDIANGNSTACLAAHLADHGFSALDVDMGDSLGRTPVGRARRTSGLATDDFSPSAKSYLVAVSPRASEGLMDRALNPRLTRLEGLVGQWELTAWSGERIMSTSRATFQWLGDRGFLVQRIDPPTYLAPAWVDAAPSWVDAVVGLDDHSDTFTMLYADSRGVCRTYRMSLDANRWTLSTQPGPDFYQRFEGTFNDDRTVIDARWEASGDGRNWSTDFNVTYRRLAG